MKTTNTVYGTRALLPACLPPCPPALPALPADSQVVELLHQYKPVAYMNGHDHVLTHAVDPQDAATYPTAYVTTGGGSAADASDSCGALTRPNVLFTNSVLPPGDDCNVAGGEGVNGFVVVTATKDSFKV